MFAFFKEKIKYFYYSKNYSEKKEEKKKDYKGIKLIKTFIICTSNLGSKQ